MNNAILGVEDGNASIFNTDSVWHLLDSCCTNFLVASFQLEKPVERNAKSILSDQFSLL